MHTGCTFNHRYVKSNPREVENATWMLTVSVLAISFLVHMCRYKYRFLVFTQSPDQDWTANVQLFILNSIYLS